MLIKIRTMKRYERLIIAVGLFLFVPFLSFLAFKDSLRLGLIGDDWLLLYTIKVIFEIQKSLSFLEPQAYLCTYCPPYSILSLIKYFFGYEPYYYFLISLLIRVGISIMLFFTTKHITKSKLAGFLSAIFFSVTVIGIQTTEWVFNHNHYLGVIFVCISIIWYFKSKAENKIKFAVISGVFFAIALIISPPRMHGFFPLVVGLEIFWFIFERKKYNKLKALFRILILLLTYRLVFTLAGGGYGTNLYLGMISESLSLMQSYILKREFVFILNPIITLGNYIVPDIVIANIATGQTTMRLVTITLMIITLITIPSLLILKIKMRGIFLFILSSGLWLVLLRTIRRINPQLFPQVQLLLALIGGIFVIFTLIVVIGKYKKEKELVFGMVLGFLWMNTYTIFPWLLAPYSYLNSTLRYSVQQGAGATIFMAAFFSILVKSTVNLSLQKETKRLILIVIFSLALGFTGMHFNLTRAYLGNLVAHRSIEVDKRLWQQLYSEVPSLSQDGMSVFYLTYDDYYMAEWVLRFGFSSRAFILYELTDQSIIPTMIYSYDDLRSMVMGGEALARYGLKPNESISIERVYGFELKNGNLINKTNEIRSKLQLELASNDS